MTVRTAERTLSSDRPAPREDDRGGDVLIVLLLCDDPRAGSSRHDLAALDEVVIRRAAARRIARADRRLELGVPDGRLSQTHARLVRELDRWVVEDAGSKNGVFVNGTRQRRAVLADGDLVQLGHTLFLYRTASASTGAGAGAGAGAARFPDDCDGATLPGAGLATFVPELARAFDDLGVVARTGAAILVEGETGTGKELVARAVHTLAGRTGSFVAVNCGALPEAIAESELFGYRRGAFSGATHDRLGLIRSADHGTLFLDEIGDLAFASQATLLRVLQEREVAPLGTSEPVAVDLQIVAATHHDLRDAITHGRFRRDLHARLAAFTLHLPPLRDRLEDFGLLIAALLARMPVPETGPVRISPDAAIALLAHAWPSNIRELAACLVVASALARGEPVRVEHLPESVRSPVRDLASAADLGEPTARPPVADDARRAELVALLTAHAGNISAVARAAKRSRVQIHRWLRQFNIDAATYRR